MLSPDQLDNLGYVSSLQESADNDNDGPGKYLCTLKAVHPLPPEVIHDKEKMRKVRQLAKRIQTESRNVKGNLDCHFGVDVENNVAMYMGVYASPVVLERIFFAIGEPVIELISFAPTEELLSTIDPADVLFGYHSLSRFVSPPIFIVVPSSSDFNPNETENGKRIQLIKKHSNESMTDDTIKVFGTSKMPAGICEDDDKFEEFCDNMYRYTQYLRKKKFCWFVENAINRDRNEYYYMHYFHSIKHWDTANEWHASSDSGGIFEGMIPVCINTLCPEKHVDYMRGLFDQFVKMYNVQDSCKIAVMKYM